MLNQIKINKIDFLQWVVLWGIVLGKYAEMSFLLITVTILIYSNRKFYSVKKILIFLLGLFIYSGALIFINSYHYGKLIQQIIALLVMIICYNQFFNFMKLNIHAIFQKYIQVIYIVSILGLIQFIISLVFKIDIFAFSLYTVDFQTSGFMRVHSFFGEPGELAAFQIPVMIYIIFNSRFYVNNKIKSIIFFVTYLVTFTATAYFILAIILLTKLYRRLKYFTIALIIVFAALLLSTSLTFDASSNDNLSDFNLLISGIQQKITESTNFSIKSDVEDFEKLNYSSYALLSNLYVAFNAPSRVFGTGLGTHQESYVRVYQSSFTGYGLNKDDGYSLINRIFSEFGYVGIIVMIIVLYKNFNSKNVINLSSFFFLLTNMLRGGNYIFLGYIFFIFLYYYSSKDIVEENSIYNNKIS